MKREDPTSYIHAGKIKLIQPFVISKKKNSLRLAFNYYWALTSQNFK